MRRDLLRALLRSFLGGHSDVVTLLLVDLVLGGHSGGRRREGGWREGDRRGSEGAQDSRLKKADLGRLPDGAKIKGSAVTDLFEIVLGESYFRQIGQRRLHVGHVTEVRVDSRAKGPQGRRT